MIQNISQLPGILQVISWICIVGGPLALGTLLFQALHAGVRMLKAKATIMECEAQEWQKKTK